MLLWLGVSIQPLLNLTDKPLDSGVNYTADCDEDNLGGWCLMSSMQPSWHIFATKVKRVWDVDSDNLALSGTTIKFSI